jgi:hypothetical protein
MGPEQDGQLSGRPLRSLEIKWSAWAGLYVFGRGFLMLPPDDEPGQPHSMATLLQSNHLNP